MKIVSDDFKKTLAMPFRPQSKAKISLDMTLPEAEDASVTLQQKAPFQRGYLIASTTGTTLPLSQTSFSLAEGRR